MGLAADSARSYTGSVAFEEELKFAVPSLSWAKAKLRTLGSQLTHEPALEENWVLDDAAGTLRQEGCLLRVRRWGRRNTVTYKGPASFSGGVKRRREVELSVSDAGKALELFASLGFAVVFRYQKVREEWRVGLVTVALDHTPMGAFLELEGPADALRPLAQDLGLELREALAASYLELWRSHRIGHPSLPEDMLFPQGEPS